MSHIFISHVEEDADIALGIALGLEEVGFRSWIYEIDSIIGTSYIVRTGEAVAESDAVVVIISPDSLSSNQVTKEVVRAHESGKKFLPILRGISHVEFQQRQPEWREAIGSATSINLPKEGVNYLIPKVIEGAKALGIKHNPKTDIERINKLHSAINNVTPRADKTAVPVINHGKTAKERKPWYKKPLTYVLSSVAIVAIIMVIILNGGINGKGKIIDNHPDPLTSGNGSSINQTSETIKPSVSTLTGSPSSTLTGTSSTIGSGYTSVTSTTTPASAPSNSPLVSIAGILSDSTQLVSGQLVSGTSIQGTLKKGEIHFYYFTATEGEPIFAVLSESTDSGSMRPWLELMGPDGVKLYDEWGYTAYSFNLAAPLTGKYTIRIRDDANIGGNYVLSFMQLSRDVNPLTPGVSIQGTLQVPGDVNWYTFNANAGEPVFTVLSESTDSGSMRPWLELFGPDGKTIDSAWGYTAYSIDTVAPSTGRYTLRIRDDANIGGSYVLSFLRASGSINPLTSGVSLQGKLQVPGDVNWYYFNASAGEPVFAVLSESTDSGSMRPWLELFGPDGKIIDSAWGYTAYSIDTVALSTGLYTLRVRDDANIGGNYILSFMQLSRPVNMLTTGVTLEGTLKVSGDVNWYMFNASAGDMLYVTLSEGESSGSMRPNLELIGPDSKIINGGWDYTTYTIDITIANTGLYTLRIRDEANIGGNYVLSFNLVKK